MEVKAADEKRLWGYIDVSDTKDCWNWIGKATNSVGYGRLHWQGKVQYAHRVAYMVEIGDIPDGLTIDHLCRNTYCCNPAHLEAVTMAENIRRAAAVNHSHCSKGHKFESGSYYLGKHGKVCKMCSHNKAVAAYAANREAEKAAARDRYWKNRDANILRMRTAYQARKASRAEVKLDMQDKTAKLK